MPIVNLMPTKYKKGVSGEVCTLVFPDPNDCGTYGLDDIHLINVWNDLDHFPGTKDRVDNFRDGVDLVFQKLMECTAICNNLKVWMTMMYHLLLERVLKSSKVLLII